MVPLPVLLTPPAFTTISVVKEPLVPTTKSPARLVVVAVMVFVVPSATSCARTGITALRIIRNGHPKAHRERVERFIDIFSRLVY